MATELLKLTAQIVISHASMSELTPKELVEEIKDVYNLLASLEAGAPAEEVAAEKAKEVEKIKKPAIPLEEVVTEKYVVCLECGKRMRTLKAHIRKAHGLAPAEYYRRFGLEAKKFPLVCKEYSEQRRRLAKEKGLGEKGFGRKKTTQG
jgi:predicted transcriptional regulator